MVDTTYGIVDWIYKKLENDEVWFTRDTLKSAINELPDNEGSIRGWMANSEDWFKCESEKTSRVLQTEVNDFNDDYQKETIEQIRAAQTTDDLNDISIDDSYETDIVNKLNQIRDKKMEELAVIEAPGEFTEEEPPDEDVVELKETFGRGRPRTKDIEDIELAQQLAGEYLEEIEAIMIDDSLADTEKRSALRAIRPTSLTKQLREIVEDKIDGSLEDLEL